MKAKLLLGLVTLTVTASFSAHAGWEKKTNYAGFNQAWLYTPSSYAPRTPNKRALVVHLMGCGQVIDQVKQASGWEYAAEEYGMYVLVPAPTVPAFPNKQATRVECYDYGYDSSGNYGAKVPTPNSPDHRKIIAAPGLMMSQLSDIDPDQVYVAGLSAGGAVAQQVACMAPDVFHGVANAAGPGLNSRQAQAVAPLNGAGMVSAQPSESSMKQQCQSWIGGKSADFQKQIWGIVSDDSFLPVGGMGNDPISGAYTFTIFNDGTVWDGDKFCPTGYHTRTVNIMKDLILGGAGVLETEVVETSANTAQGNGCGDAAANFEFDGTTDGAYGTDYSSVQCNLADAKKRDWEAEAEIYRAPSGHVKLVRIQQDTLRHAWPSGMSALQGYLDCESTNIGGSVGTYKISDLGDPNSAASQYMKNPDGSWDMRVVSNLPNGAIGCIYFNPISVDFPMYMANLWNNNNPLLGDAQGNNQAPEVDIDLSVSGYSLSVTGSITDDVSVASAKITIKNLTTGSTVKSNVSLTVGGNGVVQYSVSNLDDGIHEATITATDDEGETTTVVKSAVVGDVPNDSPVLANVAIASESNGCITVSGSATDADGTISEVVVTIAGAGETAASLSGSSFSAEVCGLAMNSTHTGDVVAVDDLGADSNIKNFSVGLPEAIGCDVAEGTVTELMASNPELITQNGWFYYTSGDNQQVWSYSNEVYTVFIGADGLGYLTEPEDCGGEDITVEIWDGESTDGDDDGDTDGSADGSNDGSADGSNDGSADGSDDGSADGSNDGSADGSDDGSADGSNDGSADGSDDGSSDGSADGSDDGSADGSDDGSNDGSVDGDPDESNEDGSSDRIYVKTGASGLWTLLLFGMAAGFLRRRR